MCCLTNECHLSKCDTICAKSCVNCTLFYCYTLPVPRGIRRLAAHTHTQRHPSCSSSKWSWNLETETQSVCHWFLKCSHKIYIIIEGYALFRPLPKLFLSTKVSKAIDPDTNREFVVECLRVEICVVCVCAKLQHPVGAY